MQQDTKAKKRRRRRDCRDRARKWALEQRQRRKPNPAAKAVAELLLLFAVLIGSMPMPTPALLLSPEPGPNPKSRRKPARKPVPPQPARPAYTRHDTYGWPSRYKGQTPTFQQLLAHVRGRSTKRREDAEKVLRHVVEPDVRYWLDDVIQRAAWGDLAAVIKPGMDADAVNTAMLRAAIQWTRIEREDAKVPGDSGKKGTDETPGDDLKKGPK